jgi:DNA-binding NarL/FixJ family response regulator
LKLVAEGKTNKEIAEILTISVKTAMAHRANIADKLGIHNRAELIKFALQRGIVQ